MIKRIKSLSKVQWAAIGLIVIGLAVMAVKGLGMLSFYREIQYARQNNFEAGNPPVEALRPWMTLRYVATSYGVPQMYLYNAIGIQARPETSMLALNRLNQQLGLGQFNGQPRLLVEVRQTITEYRAAPVVTGLLEQHVEGWMTMQYIANSTGVPVESYFKALNLPMGATDPFAPLDVLARKLNYTGGPQALTRALDAAVQQLAPPNPLQMPAHGPGGGTPGAPHKPEGSPPPPGGSLHPGSGLSAASGAAAGLPGGSALLAWVQQIGWPAGLQADAPTPQPTAYPTPADDSTADSAASAISDGSDLSTLILGWMATYGAPLVAVVLYITALGVPLPGTVIVIASGAFIRQSMLDAYTTPLEAYLGTILGDVTLYALAYLAGGWINRRFGGTSGWIKARELFMRRGGIAIYLSRWILTAVATPVTLVAGSSRYPFGKFLLFDMLGEATWFALFGGLGYALGSQWELVSDFISNFSGFLLGGVVLGLGVYVLLKAGKRKSEPAAEALVEAIEAPAQPC